VVMSFRSYSLFYSLLRL